MGAGSVRSLTLFLCRTAVVALALSLMGQSDAGVRLTAGLILDRSVTVRPGAYRLAASDDLSRPAIIIRGDNITVDFAGAVLAGGPDEADPDTYAGVGIFIDGGRNVTVKNAKVRGYKVGIRARQSADLHLTNNDLSYNWKPRLYSGVEKESLVDWMSYHQNDRDEWLSRGAAIYLSECDRAKVDHNTILQGQNGLMVTRSAGLLVWNNTIQFMSGIGVGFYRTSDSTIAHNRIDWCVRGYSHGFYNRGQDSAGLLMYEQSSRNKVAHNSITHGGDGLFLWAGQSTMDSGQGGSNDNAFQENDFSHAVTNGIEATFSRNAFIANRVEDCWHGVWGGYSYDSVWALNRFARNGEGIAIEHGQNNAIEGNRFEGDEIGIRLWQNASQDPNWGYPKSRDTRSRGYVLAGNTFRQTKTALDIRATTDIQATLNTFESVGTRLAGDVELPLGPPAPVFTVRDFGPAPSLPGAIDPMIRDDRLRGRHRIIVDEWGPYDWKSPKLWPAGRSDAAPLTLRVLGPEGQWKVVSARGANVAPREGRVPSELLVTPSTAAPVDFTVSLEYRGGDVISPRGARTAAGRPYVFSYSRFFMPIAWTVKFIAYDDGSDPIKQPEAFSRLLISGPALGTLRTNQIDYMSARPFEDGVPRDRFALVAQGVATLPPGDYILQVISDDGVRVWMDDRKILDEWTPHESKVSRVPIRGGQRRFKIEYYEIGGFAELRFDIQRK